MNQEHIVQWHPTILTKLALVPQRTMNAYASDLVYTPPDKDDPKDEKKGKPPIASKTSSTGTFKDGDFLVRFAGCESDEKTSCEGEMGAWWVRWRRRVEELDGKKESN
jgi:mannan polymerase II complex MNN11 subunit